MRRLLLTFFILHSAFSISARAASASVPPDTKPLPATETCSFPATASAKGGHRYIQVPPAPAPRSGRSPIVSSEATGSTNRESKIENSITITYTGIPYPSLVTHLATATPLPFTYDTAARTLTITLPAALRAKTGNTTIYLQIPSIAAPTPPLPANDTLWTPPDAPNTPIGTARGIHPGRVTWARDLAATPWDGVTGNWWADNTGINQPAVDNMLSRSLRALALMNNEKCGMNNDQTASTPRPPAGAAAPHSTLSILHSTLAAATTDATATDSAAWEAIFRYFNNHRSVGAGDRGYQPNEKLAIKINVNNAYAGYQDADNQIDASMQTIRAMLRQLVHNAGVPETAITVYEATRVIPDRIFLPLHAEFPRVTFADSKGSPENGRAPVHYAKKTLHYSVPDPKVGEDLPTFVLEAAYIINIALVKGHPTTGVSLTAKNHYGTVNVRDHTVYVNASAHPLPAYHPFVDMIGSRQLGEKTLLYMLDGLYALRDVNDAVGENARWHTLFNGEWLASIFLSQDPVAIDSVGLDFLRAEFPLGRGKKPNINESMANADNYLHEAAQANNPPSGTHYAPDGVPLKSLGVHEHWNNAQDKRYTRNLDPQHATGIELYTVPVE